MTTPPASVGPALSPTLIDRSCLPLTFLFLSAAVWLLLGSCFGLIASIKFHSPSFLADSAWLTYGRVHPVCVNAMLYGFALQAGLGMALWLLARLGNVLLLRGLLVVVGAVFLNLGILAGLGGILAGDSTGYENLEMPGYSSPLIFVGYLLITVPGLLTFHFRERRPLFPSQWFLLTAVFWFPWIYCTAELLLASFPVRGMTQMVIAWWYSQNLVEVWLGLVGLAGAFYFVPALTGRPLKSRYLALFAFWILILFSSWAGIPKSAPVPAWMPALSSASRVIGLSMVIAVALNVYGTLGRFVIARPSSPPLSFVLFGVAAFFVGALMGVLAVFCDFNQLLQFSWFGRARFHLQLYGFFVMICLGAVYHILPRLAGIEFPWAGLVRVHFWLAAAGVVLIALPFALGGVVQARNMHDSAVPFVDVARSTLPFLRASTLGDLLLVIGHLLLVTNAFALVAGLCRAHLRGAYKAATEDLFKPAEARV